MIAPHPERTLVLGCPLLNCVLILLQMPLKEQAMLTLTDMVRARKTWLVDEFDKPRIRCGRVVAVLTRATAEGKDSDD